MTDRLDTHQFRQLIRRRAHAAGSQEALAKSLDVSAQYLSDVLRSKREPSAALAGKLGFRRDVLFVPVNGAAQERAGA